MGALLALLLGRSSKGGRSSLFATFGVVLGAVRLLRRVTAKKEKVVFSERLGPGERLLISSTVPAGRRSRRSAGDARPPG